MIESLLAQISWEAALGVGAAVWGVITAKRVRRAGELWFDLYKAVEDAREDRKWTSKEVQEVVEKGYEAFQATSPLVAKLAKTFKNK